MAPNARAKSSHEDNAQQAQPEMSVSSTVAKQQGPNKTITPAPTTTQSVQTAVAHGNPGPRAKTAIENAERKRKDAESLAAVNGIVIPSKVGPGRSPDQGCWKKNERMVYPCAICERKFVRKYQVKSHMPACVNRNGNPDGMRWDDACSQRAVQENSEPSDQDTVAEDYDEHEDEFPESDPSNASQIMVEVRAYQSSSVESSYNDSLRVDVLTNEALLAMLQAWFDCIGRLGKHNVQEHPHCQKVLKEMVARGMIDRDGKWLVDPVKTDMEVVWV